MRIDDGRVISTFVRQALQGEDLTVHGDGEQTRSFCYVSDMIDGLLSLMEVGVEEPVNIGSPDGLSILALAELVIEMTGSASGITHEPRPPHDPALRRPDISKSKAEVGWEPKVDLEEGLEQSIEYFESVV